MSSAAQGKVPRNEYGNLELFKPSMLPAGGCHIASKCRERSVCVCVHTLITQCILAYMYNTAYYITAYYSLCVLAYIRVLLLFSVCVLCLCPLSVAGIQKVCRKLAIDFAPAVVGWDFHSGRCHPV